MYHPLHVQAANFEAEASGVQDGEYHLRKHEYSSLGRGKYGGVWYIFQISLSLSHTLDEVFDKFRN